MRIIDKRGMIFGKTNLIDAFVLVCILSLAPAIYFGFKFVNKPIEEEPPATQYEMSYTCPVCKKAIPLEIDFGEILENNFKARCPNCKNEVIVNKPRPDPDLTYQERYYKHLLKKEK